MSWDLGPSSRGGILVWLPCWDRGKHDWEGHVHQSAGDWGLGAMQLPAGICVCAGGGEREIAPAGCFVSRRVSP